MSRAYRIKVGETLNTTVTADDSVSSQLELLNVLPADQMSEILEQELLKDGFEKEGDQLVKKSGDVTVSIEPKTGIVTVHSALDECLELASEKEGHGDEDFGEAGREELRETLRSQAQADLRRQAGAAQQKLQKEATDKLEQELAGVQADLSRVINRTVSEAVKKKAGQLGQIKELHEDPDKGELTIVLEV